MKNIFTLILFLASLGFSVSAQDSNNDTVLYEDANGVLTGDLSPVVLVDSVWHPDPKKATMLSAAFPGAGQIYNGQWWKAPFIYAGLGTLGYFISWNNTLYIRYRNAFLDFTDDDPTTNRYLEVIPDGYEITDDSWFETTVNNRKEGYRRDRDFLIICTVGVYVLNILEANVAAHLHDFDVSDDLSMSVVPDMGYNNMNNSATLGLSLTFNINK